MADPINDEPRFSEPELRKVIERAAQLEHAHSDSVSLSELREIARDLGIPDAALKAALAERRWPTAALVPGRWRRVGHPISLAAVGGLGSIALMTIPVLGFWGFVSIAAFNLFWAVDANRPKAYALYLQRSLGMWIGFLGTAALRYGLPDAMATGILGGISLTGIAIIVVVRGLTAKIDSGDTQGPAPLRHRVSQAFLRIRAWLHKVTQMTAIGSVPRSWTLGPYAQVALRHEGPDFS